MQASFSINQSVFRFTCIIFMFAFNVLNCCFPEHLLYILDFLKVIKRPSGKIEHTLSPGRLLRYRCYICQAFHTRIYKHAASSDNGAIYHSKYSVNNRFCWQTDVDKSSLFRQKHSFQTSDCQFGRLK